MPAQPIEPSCRPLRSHTATEQHDFKPLQASLPQRSNRTHDFLFQREPAANPYLFLMSQIVCGLDGIERNLTPSSPANEPYTADAPGLPRSLIEAVSALRKDSLFRAQLGDLFVDYILTLKEFEISRFLSEVTDWEQKEYFDLF